MKTKCLFMYISNHAQETGNQRRADFAFDFSWAAGSENRVFLS